MSNIYRSIFGDKKKQEGSQLPSQMFKYKTRFSVLGTVGSGKTTVSALTVLTTQTLSNNLPNFTCRTLEGSSSILQAASDLRRGRFPPKTPPDAPAAFESGLLMKWSEWKGGKHVHVPICDVAGEDIQGMIVRFGANMYTPGAQAYAAAVNLINYVKDSDGFIVVIPASRALIFADDYQMEKENEDISADPDVNVTHILDAVISHKEQCRGRPIKGIAVVITKWDLLAPYAIQKGMDLYDPTGQGIRNFMESCFPATSQLLKNYGLAKVKFFPSYVTVERDSQGQLKTWNDGSYRIKTDMEEPNPKRIPKYAEQSYVQLIDYLKTFAA